MVRIMRIVSVCAVILAMSSAGWIGMGMFKDPPEKPEVIVKEDVVDLLIKLKNIKKPPTKESPLVAEARKFALGIDPPPPPKPIVEPKTTRPTGNTATTITKPVKPVVTPTGPKGPIVNVSYNVLATAAYADHPDKSLVLLDLTSIGQKWVRIGEKINHDIIEEIQDGQIIISRNGQRQPAIPITRQNPVLKFKSLLKSEQDETTATTSVVGSPVLPPTTTINRAMPTTRTTSSTTLPTRNIPGRSGYSPPGSTVPVQNRTGSSFAPRPNIIRKPPVMPSPKEQKEMLDGNITDIKKLMGTSAPGLTEKEKEEEMKAWKDLLEILEKEKINLDGSDKKPPPSTEK